MALMIVICMMYIPPKFEKMFIEVGKDQDIREIREKLPKQYYITFSRDGYGFVLPKEISKYSAIEKILNKDGLQIDYVLAFGDDENDIELIQKSGIGIAMGNALSDVKKVANFITKSNNDNGVAYVLKGLQKKLNMKK